MKVETEIITSIAADLIRRAVIPVINPEYPSVRSDKTSCDTSNKS